MLKNPFVGESYTNLKKSLLALMIRSKDMLFRKGQDPNGQPWAPLSPVTIARRNARTPAGGESKGHQILVDRGILKNSLTQASNPYGVNSTDANEVALGTNVAYARIHQDGGRVSITKDSFGRTLEQARSAFIPARPFIGFGQQDEETIGEKVLAWLDREAGFKK